MKYIVDIFDGHSVGGVLVEKDQLTTLLSNLAQLKPEMGVYVLDITPESVWRRKQREKQAAEQPIVSEMHHNPKPHETPPETLRA